MRHRQYPQSTQPASSLADRYIRILYDQLATSCRACEVATNLRFVSPLHMARHPARRGLLAAAICAALVFVASTSSGGDYEPGDSEASEVVALTTANFDAQIKSHAFTLVRAAAMPSSAMNARLVRTLLYSDVLFARLSSTHPGSCGANTRCPLRLTSSDRCGHCKTLAPEYAAAAASLKASRPDVLLAKVDATVETELGSRFDVKGFPTLKWFTAGGAASDYGGGRTAPEIVSWVSKKSRDPLQLLTSAAEADAFRESAGSYALVALVADVQGMEAATLRLAATQLDEVFGVTSSPEVAQHLGIIGAQAPAVAMLKSFDEPVIVLDAAATPESLMAFVIKYSKPLVIAFTQDNSATIFKSSSQLLCFTPPGAAQGVEDALLAAAQAMRGSGIQFVTVDPAREDVKQVVEFFGVSTDITGPIIFGFSNAHARVVKSRMPSSDGTQAVEAITAFARSVLDSSAMPIFNSEPVPATNDGPVTIVVGHTFNSIVLAQDKDVLLEVYAPWCGHCKSLEPVYEKLGRRFANVDSVVIAKMDGTLNEHPSAHPESYPTLLFFAAGETQGQGVPYEGDRTLKALTKWIKTQATIPYSLPLKQSAEEPVDGAEHDELR